MLKFNRKRCRNCNNYRPSLEFRESHYCKIGLCDNEYLVYIKLRGAK